jgi:hypothetical protein
MADSGDIAMTSEDMRAQISSMAAQLKALQQNAPPVVAPVAAPAARLEKVPWPEWDGTQEKFALYFVELKAKIEGSRGVLGTGRDICLAMNATLPAAQKELVSGWFLDQAASVSGTDWNYEAYLEVFREQFEDTLATQNAIDTLFRMRQNRDQLLADFLKDWLYTLRQCRGSGSASWPDAVAIGHLHHALNDKLKDKIVAVWFSWEKTDLADTIRNLKGVACVLEGMPGYQPVNSAYTKTFYARQAGAPIQVPQGENRPGTDHEGDVAMTGMSAVQIAALKKCLDNNSGDNRAKGSTKPRARWRSQEEFERLREAKLCSRCEKPGHIGPNCRTYRAAIKPSVNAATTATSPCVCQQSGNEEP